ncbi:MAG: methyltransferase [Bacilli bacterium]|nr:methyltransferase [Bacilli bacterium]
MLVKNDLFDYKNRYIYQDSDFFKFSVDSILLAEYIKLSKKNLKILDMCAGNMAVPLILSTYTKDKIVGFEIQSSVYKLAKKSIETNNLNEQLQVINDDVNNLGNYFSKEYFDIMLCNPPYFKYNEDKVVNEKVELKYARHEIAIDLDQIFKLAKSFLVNKGSLYLVHRAERLDEIINLGYKYQINVKKVQLVTTKKGGNPYIVLVECIKNSKPGIKFNCEICIDGVKSYQNIFKEEV